MKLKNLLLAGLMIFLGLRTWADTEPTNDNFSGADAMTVGVAESGTINMSGDLVDYFVFTTTDDGSISLNLSTADIYYCVISLIDNDGSTLITNAGNYYGVSLTANGLAAGTYYAAVSTSGYSGSYSYTASLSSPSEANDVETNDTPATALLLAENGSTTGHIQFRNNGGGLDTYDYYQLTTTNDGSISLSVTTGLYFSYLTLFDNDGSTVLGSIGNYYGTGLNVSGLAAGTYYVLVQGYSIYAGGYTLSTSTNTDGIVNDIETNDTPASALSLAENGSTTGHIQFRKNGGSVDNYDYYQLTTTNDGTVAIYLTTSLYFTYLTLFDSDGTTVLSSAGNYYGNNLNVAGLAAGTYYVRVEGYSVYAGGYNLSTTTTTDGIANDTEINDTPASSSILTENSSTTGHINFRKNGGLNDIYDYYQINTTNDGTISLTLTTGIYYTILTLFDNDGTTVISSAGNYYGNGFNVGGLAAGTYYVRVEGYSIYSGGYTISTTTITDGIANDAELNDTPATSVSMLTNSNSQGHIQYRKNGGTYDTYDYYKVVTHSTGNLSFSLTTSIYYTIVTLFASDGITSLGSLGNYYGNGLNFTGLAAGTYYFRVEGTSYAGGYTLTNTFCPDAITIVAEGETTLCEGESVTLSTEDHHLSYDWSDGSITETIAALYGGDYSLTIDNGGGCIRSSNTITVDVTPNPVATISADGPTEFCAGGDVTLSVPSGPDAWLWSTGETTPTISVSTTGDYSVQLFKNSCTAISDPIHITVNANPTPTISADGPITFCDGGSVTLTSNSAASYLWSDGSTGSSVLADASGDFSVTVTDANGCSGTSATTTVTENANPTAGISSDGPTEFCSGGSVNLTATGGTSYLWSNGSTGAVLNVSTSGDYSCTVTNAAGCSDVTSVITVSVTLCGTVSISAGGPITFCDGGSVVLTSSEVSGNVWSNGETTQSITVNTTGDFYCVNGINTSNTISVTVNPNPDATITAGSETEFCEGGSTTISASEIYDSYLWSNGETTSEITVTESGSYSVVITNDGCSSTSSNIDVIVNENPTPTISADGPTSFCSGSVNLMVDGSYSSYAWNNGETTGTINVTDAGDYFTTVTDANGCSGVSNTISVTTGTAPTVTIAALGGTTICYSGSVTLTATASSGNLQWYRNASMIGGATSDSYTTSMPGLYTCIATDGGCSSNSNSISVKAVKKLNVSPEGPVTVCPGGSTTISVAAYPGATYQWYKSTSAISGATSNSYAVTSAGKYYCIVTKAGCDRRSKDVFVTSGCKEAELAIDVWTIYPNPSADYFAIEFNSNTEQNLQIVISDLTGKVMNTKQVNVSEGSNTIEYDTNQFPSGMYIVSISDLQKTISVQKLVIEK